MRHVDRGLAGEEPVGVEHLLAGAGRVGEGGVDRVLATVVGQDGVDERLAERVGGADQVDEDERDVAEVDTAAEGHLLGGGLRPLVAR